MKKFSLIALVSVFALNVNGAFAGETAFEELLGGDAGSVVRRLSAADAQKISFPVPAGMESCKYDSVQGDTCSFICKSGATVKRPRLDSSVAQNGGCALFVMVPVQNKAAKDLFDGPKETEVENPAYICQAHGGGYAIATAGKTPRIWQLGGLAEGANAGLELGDVAITQESRPGRLEASGTLTFFGETLKIGLSVRPDAKNGGKPALTATLNGETALQDVPCRTYSPGAETGRTAAAAARVYAEGRLYAYNRASKQYDIDMALRCSVTLENFKTYLDTQHGSPREVVSADYRLGGFPDLEKYSAGNAVASAPDQYSNYANLQNYYQSGLAKGVDVSILLDNVASTQEFVTRPTAPTSVYVAMEKSATSYFGGDGTKWGYWCDMRGGAAR